jgi:hypothetical protein
MQKFKQKQTSNILQTIITSKKKSIENKQTKIINLEKQIESLNDEWEKCIGPFNILKAK